MINIPFKDYQFTGIIALIGTLMWGSIVFTDSVNTNTGHLIEIHIMLIFAIGVILSLLGTIATVLCFFAGDNVRFK